MAGSNGLTKTGGGTVVLSNSTNSYTGNTTVSAGVLAVTAPGRHQPGVRRVDIARRGDLRAGRRRRGQRRQRHADRSGPGCRRWLLDRTLTTEVVTLATANPSYSGEVVINGGTLRVTDAGALGTADGTEATGVAVTGGAELDTGRWNWRASP